MASAFTVVCAVCNAQPGEPCSQPSNTGRRSVGWFHHKREESASQSTDYAQRRLDAMIYGDDDDTDRRDKHAFSL